MTRTIAVLLAIGLFFTPAALAQTAATPCQPRPATDGIAAIIEGAESLALESQGRIGFEGDEPDARPLPPASLHDLAGDLAASMRSNARAGAVIRPDAFYFTFYAETAPSRDRDVIPAPKSVLWCLARRGDTVLLSDGQTHHITSVFSINRDSGIIFILDPWPERFFMLAGKNVRGYTARLVDAPDPLSLSKRVNKLVSIPRDQFLKVLVGLVTLDGPELVDYFALAHPAAAKSATTSLAFGVGFLHWSDDRFVDRAIPLLRRANEIARANGNKADSAYSANRLHLALLLQYYYRRLEGNQRGAAETMAGLQELWDRYGKDQLFASNRAIDFFRLGLCASTAGDFAGAVNFFTSAIESKADYEEAFLRRAIAYGKQENAPRAVADASEALRLNAIARLALAKQKAARHRRDVIGQQRDAGTEIYLEQWRALALQTRATAYRGLGESGKSLEDARALVAMSPNGALGHFLIGLAQIDAGNAVDARRALERAAQLERDPEILMLIGNTLAKIAP